jgi:hypothetical protein
MMPEKAPHFLTSDGKTRLTLSGAYEQMLEGLIVSETENAVEVVDSGDKLLPDPVNDGDFNVVKLHQQHKEIIPVTPITKMVSFTPSKSTDAYHCEMAGEGIEYCWGFYKKTYCRTPLWQKGGSVLECVKKSLGIV